MTAAAPSPLPRAPRWRARVRQALLVCAALGPALALAQYKVIGPDGKVTYTDRPDRAAAGSTVRDLPVSGAAASAAQAGETDLSRLPYALRQAARTAPVKLYTSTPCTPCERARQLLRERGVPYQEITARANLDGDALERLAGTRTVPILAVGARLLPGLSDRDWLDALTAAGYPERSQLPANWRMAAPQPLVPLSPPVAEVRGAPTAAAPSPLPPAPPAPKDGPNIRF